MGGPIYTAPRWSAPPPPRGAPPAASRSSPIPSRAHRLTLTPEEPPAICHPATLSPAAGHLSEGTTPHREKEKEKKSRPLTANSNPSQARRTPPLLLCCSTQKTDPHEGRQRTTPRRQDTPDPTPPSSSRLLRQPKTQEQPQNPHIYTITRNINTKITHRTPRHTATNPTKPRNSLLITHLQHVKKYREHNVHYDK